MSEKDLQKLVEELAEWNGWKYYHVPDSRRVTSAGFPDLVLVRPPRIIYAELKVGSNKLSPAQLEWKRDLQACNLEFYIWRETKTSIERIKETLKK
jgi:hypothetical protein